MNNFAKVLFATAAVVAVAVVAHQPASGKLGVGQAVSHPRPR